MFSIFNFFKRNKSDKHLDNDLGKPVEALNRNVGVAHLSIHYLNDNNEVVILDTNIEGYAIWDCIGYDEYTWSLKTIDAHKMLSLWLQDGVKYGVYTVNETALIPTSRVTIIDIEYEDLIKEYENKHNI